MADPAFAEKHYFLRNVTAAEVADMAQQAGIGPNDTDVFFRSLGKQRWRLQWRTPDGERHSWEGTPTS